MIVALRWQRLASYGVWLCLSIPAMTLANEPTPDLFPYSPSALLSLSSTQPNQPRSTPDLFQRRPRPSPPPSTPSPRILTVAELEQAIHVQVNQYRLSKGLLPLLLDARIS
ncbi:MAG: hypothetical protein NZ772_01305 [Cyanobacteria bacterium]|nr:hypothetical protein [Cyanobacteriota bacterium]MDW8200051.1 hypothetical protein [Cyanobacteriota bacterium SKYGB_h_bin112]